MVARFLMPVYEWPVSGLAFQTPSNEVGDVLPLLFGGRGDARYGLPVGHSARGGIADGEDLRATSHRQVGTNDHSTRTIRRSTQPASRGRRLTPAAQTMVLAERGLPPYTTPSAEHSVTGVPSTTSTPSFSSAWRV